MLTYTLHLSELTKEFLAIYERCPSRLQKKITEPMKSQVKERGRERERENTAGTGLFVYIYVIVLASAVFEQFAKSLSCTFTHTTHTYHYSPHTALQAKARKLK